MNLKKLVATLRRAILCCNDRKSKPEPAMQIGLPTNVRRVDISALIPGLSDSERREIHANASRDAVNIAGLQLQASTRPTTASASRPTTSHRHPSTSPLQLNPFHPSGPPTSTSSPTSVYSPSSVAPSFSVPCEPVDVALNAASTHLPSSVPTPPQQLHDEDSSPPVRTKSMRGEEKEAGCESSSEDSFKEVRTSSAGGAQGSIHAGTADLWYEVQVKQTGTDADTETVGPWGRETVSVMEAVDVPNTGSKEEQNLEDGESGSRLESRYNASTLNDGVVGKAAEDTRLVNGMKSNTGWEEGTSLENHQD
ncbi:hypothetical protein P153DRAFT_385786 [Dothidotthia symphoricarpi CBS 119687]|uniref:Uncharacterized protein n=1 Tax=Dothidotthia symphoricarpi CBS 119687 TaxID=1392245 RepID=A0A6A6ACT1_9PLEO|nr:uncharacterized protein P153DRAFT_385786 [Dothidotthia symphoricarpi CBS 119687]KAF2129580.1 hypothetical protein P153DRAFT_385786 [Dothidotthia symphoricarpi CBS 119687]